jgi:antirestriction protein ArdC
MSFDVYQAVTDRLVAQLEKDVGEWRMPWHGEGLQLPKSVAGRHYRGINIPVLWVAAEAKGYASPIWATYRQWSETGAQVRKGERSTMVVVWKEFDATPKDDDDNGRRFVARAFNVFNAEQVDDFEAPTPDIIHLPDSERIAHLDAFFAGLGATVIYGGNRAFYRHKRNDGTGDEIHMPPFSSFFSAWHFYATLGHEHIHWVGAPDRLNREFGRFGDQAYSFEELVAEWGAAYLCAILGLDNEPRADHAAYMQGWLAILRKHPRAVFTAASKAQQAVDYLIGKQQQTEVDEAA